MCSTSLISTKTCTVCGESKPVTDFYTTKSRHGRIYPKGECKACTKARVAKWQEDNPEKVRTKQRNYKRGLIGCTPEDYDRMYDEQNGRCGICLESFEMLCVDHCHETGRIRGLLCSQCNKSLGGFMDDRERLLRAAEWI